MEGPAAATPGSSPAVTLAIIAAAVCVAGFALVGIAWMMGWIGTHDSAPSPPGAMAAPGSQVAGVAPDEALLPGESIVTAPPPPKSAIPTPAPSPAPAAPKAAMAPPAPTPKVATAAPPPRVPVQRVPPVVAAAPVVNPPPVVTPSPVAPPEHTEVTRARIVPRDDREICVNCGVIVEAASEPRGAYWDVIVRYDDGTTQTLRYPERQEFRPGERVHLEDGRLVPERRR